MADTDDVGDDLLDRALEDFHSLNSLQQSSSSDQHGEDGAHPTVQMAKSQLSESSPSSSAEKTEPWSCTHHEHLLETLEKLTQQTKRTLQGLHVASKNEKPLEDCLLEDLVNEFEEFSAAQEMQSVMDRVMQQLLSKEVLYGLMKDIQEIYPQWLTKNKLKVDKDYYLLYSRQYELIKQLCNAYEAEPTDFQKIIDIMKRMQECGEPPAEIMEKLAPSLELDGLSMLSELLPGEIQGVRQDCCIM